MKIFGNKHWRELQPKCYLAEKYQKELDWADDDEMCFIYKGNVYALGEFERTTELKEYDGVHHDTFFSGILIKLHPEGDAVQVFWFYA